MRSTRRPERIKILGKPYRVEYVPLNSDKLEGNNALCVPDEQRIYMADSLPLETEQDLLWHEIKHAVEGSMGLDLDDSVIERLATGELAVIKENPALLTYLRRKK